MTAKQVYVTTAALAVLAMIPVAVFAVTFTKNTTVTGDASVLGALSKGSGTFMIESE
jgi:hypothetical protein